MVEHIPEKISQQMTSEWALQADVITAVIGVLEQPEPTIEKIFAAINENQVVRKTPRNLLLSALSNHLNLKYGIPLLSWDKNGTEYLHKRTKTALLDVLGKQRDWLAARRNDPRGARGWKGLPPEVQNAIEERYFR